MGHTDSHANPLEGFASFHGGHSAFGDGEGSVEDIALAAAGRGLSTFGFTEHFLVPPHRQFNPDGLHGDCHLDPQSIGRYVASVQAAKQQYDGQLEILLGVELEFIQGALEWTRQRVEQWPFDYLVGSVHYVRYSELDICVDWDRAQIREALRQAGSPERLYLDYLDHVLELLDWRLAHVIGHLDLIKILLKPEEQTITPAIRSRMRGVLETMRSRGVAMDVNARGLIKPCQAIYPSDWVLADAHRIGVSVTLGDDSHSSVEVGARLELAVASLRNAGYTHMMLVRPGGVLEQVVLPEC